MPRSPALKIAAPAPDPAAARAMELAMGGTMTIPAAVAFSGICRSTLFERLDDGSLASTKVGRRRLIFKLSLAELLAKNAHVGQ